MLSLEKKKITITNQSGINNIGLLIPAHCFLYCFALSVKSRLYVNGNTTYNFTSDNHSCLCYTNVKGEEKEHSVLSSPKVLVTAARSYIKWPK